MPFEPGHKKIGGRQKGSPNKDTLRLIEKCKEANFDPLKEFFAKYSGIDNDEAACQILLKFMKFIYPERKSVEGSIELDDLNDRPKLELTKDNILEIVKAARGKG